MSTPPDPTNPDLLKGLRNYLVSLDLVRDPRVAGTAPPMWLAPRNGTPAPSEAEGLNATEVGSTLVTAILPATGIAPAPYEGFIRIDGVEFVVRSQTVPLAKEFENNVRAAINDKRGWLMDNVPVNESMLFRDLQLVTANNQAFTYTFEYLFNLWGPFTPVGP